MICIPTPFRRFNEAQNQTAADQFTPREVIRLMVNRLFRPDSQILRTKKIVKTKRDGKWVCMFSQESCGKITLGAHFSVLC